MIWALVALAGVLAGALALAVFEIRRRAQAGDRAVDGNIRYLATIADQRSELDRRGRQIDDRDRANRDLTADRDRALAACEALRRQRDAALQALEQLAQQHPQALGAAVRGQLDRLRELSEARAGVPRAAAAAEARDRPGDDAVHGAAAEVRDPALA